MKVKKIIVFYILVFIFSLPLNAGAEVVSDSNEQFDIPTSYDANGEEKISLDLKDVDIVELLRIISLKTGKTVVASKEITGRITIYLNNVAFKDVLDIILLTQGLASDKQGDIFYVMSSAEYKRIYGKDYIEPRKIKTVKLSYGKPSNIFNAISQLKSDIGKIVADEATGTLILIDIPDKLELMEKSIKELDQPLQTKVYDLNYAKSADAKAQISAALTQGTGEVIIDERNGKAIISDLPKKMEKIGRLIKEIDEETRQVFLEVDIIEVKLNNTHDRGIDWKKLFGERKQDSLKLESFFPSGLSSFYQQLSVGTFATNNYQIILSALETYGNTKIIAQPKIMVVNNEEANVMVGTREAYVTTSTSQTSGAPSVTSESVEFVDVGTKLKIVPTINKEGFIIMKIKPERSSAETSLDTGSGNKIPIVTTSEAETVVKVKDGAMIMIGGLKKEEKKDSGHAFPLLGRIPFFKFFFSQRTRESDFSELVIFITPHLTRGMVPLEGDEPEKNIPREMMPPNVKRKLIREETMDKLLSEQIKKSQFAEKVESEIKENSQEVKQLTSDELQKRFEPPVVKEVKEKKIKKEVKAKEEKKIDKKDKPIPKPKPKDVVKTTPGVVKKVNKSSKNLLSKRAEEFYYKSRELQASGSWGEAIMYAQKAVLLDSKYAPAYNQLGILYESNNETERAREMYLKAIDADANYLPAYSNLAALSEDGNNTREALKFWRKRTELGDPNDSWTKEALRRIKELEK